MPISSSFKQKLQFYKFINTNNRLQLLFTQMISYRDTYVWLKEPWVFVCNPLQKKTKKRTRIINGSISCQLRRTHLAPRRMMFRISRGCEHSRLGTAGLLRAIYLAFQIVVRVSDEADDVPRIFVQFTDNWFGNHPLEFLQRSQSFIVKAIAIPERRMF